MLLNPLPHIHNVIVNGIVLGGAKTGDVYAIRRDLRKGIENDWVKQATEAGAMSSEFTKNILKEMSKISIKEVSGGKKVIQTGKKSLEYMHDVLWDTDTAIRAALYKKSIEEGMSEAQAAAKTREYLIDYSNLTNFEKKFLKPLTQFYAWTKGNTILQMKALYRHPSKYYQIHRFERELNKAMGGPDDKDRKPGQIFTGLSLAPGVNFMYDWYTPTNELNKVMEHGLFKWAYGRLNAPIKFASSSIADMITNVREKQPVAKTAEDITREGSFYLNPFTGGNPFNVASGEIGRASCRERVSNWV
jgi:hypothetical protein